MNKNIQTSLYSEVDENCKVRQFNYASTVQEKLVKRGAAALKDSELLQIIVGNSKSDIEIPEVANKVHRAIRQIGEDNVTIDDLLKIDGVCEVTASLFFAALEFWRRKFSKSHQPIIDSPKAAAKQFDDIKTAKKEHVCIITLNGGRHLINRHLISIGTLTSSLVHPREVFYPAIEDNAASIILAHNHPSGSLTLSPDDQEVTKRIQDAGELLGIPLDDHLVVTESGFTSVPLK